MSEGNGLAPGIVDPVRTFEGVTFRCERCTIKTPWDTFVQGYRTAARITKAGIKEHAFIKGALNSQHVQIENKVNESCYEFLPGTLMFAGFSGAWDYGGSYTGFFQFISSEGLYIPDEHVSDKEFNSDWLYNKVTE